MILVLFFLFWLINSIYLYLFITSFPFPPLTLSFEPSLQNILKSNLSDYFPPDSQHLHLTVRQLFPDTFLLLGYFHLLLSRNKLLAAADALILSKETMKVK